jgi:hypothetical protein
MVQASRSKSPDKKADGGADGGDNFSSADSSNMSSDTYSKLQACTYVQLQKGLVPKGAMAQETELKQAMAQQQKAGAKGMRWTVSVAGPLDEKPAGMKWHEAFEAGPKFDWQADSATEMSKGCPDLLFEVARKQVDGWQLVSVLKCQ